MASLDPETGKTLKVGRVSGQSGYFSSPVAGDGKIYLLSQKGELSVISAEPEWQQLSRSDFQEEAYATPAISEGRIYLRTTRHLYCFGLPVDHGRRSTIGEGNRMQLKEKVTLVTGGATGIGLAVARQFSAEGATVVICGRNEKRLQAAALTIRGAGAVHPWPLDVTDRTQVGELVRKAIDRFGKIDILVNNAGVNVVERTMDRIEPAELGLHHGRECHRSLQSGCCGASPHEKSGGRGHYQRHLDGRVSGQ